MDDLPTWITAAATVATALLTGTGGIAAWLALSRERRKELPILERSYRWRKDYLGLALVVRNRLPESITLDSLKVISPKGMTITTEYTPQGRYGEPGSPIKGTIAERSLGYEVRPLGTSRTDFSVGDVGHFNFELWPPPSFSSGTVKIEARISSKADTMRNRRLVVTNQIPVAPSDRRD